MKTFKLPSGAVVKKPFNKLWIVLATVLILVYIFSFFIFAVEPFFKIDELSKVVVKMFSPRRYQNWGDYFRYMLTLREPLIETLTLVFSGTLIGVVIAIPVAILCAKNINKIKWLRFLVRSILNLYRTIPLMILAATSVYLVGIGILPGIMAITGFSFGIMAKMLFEIIETVDMSLYEALESTGATKTQAVIKSIIPQVLPMYISYTIYIFEINIRASVIFGYFGAGGIGTIIKDNAGTHYERVGATVILLLVVVLVVQFISNYVRGKLQ